MIRQLLRELWGVLSRTESASSDSHAPQPEAADDLLETLVRLAPSLAANAQTQEVQRLLVAGLENLARRGHDGEITEKIAYLLGTSLLSIGDAEGALRCARSRARGVPAGAEVLDLRIEPSLPAYCRRMGLPVEFDSALDVRPMFTAAATPPGVEAFVARLPDARVLGTSYIPVTVDGVAFAERCIHYPDKITWFEANEQFDTALLGTSGRLLAAGTGLDRHEGVHVLVGSSYNIGHWLLNYFPRLMMAPRIPGFEQAKVVVGADAGDLQLDCLAAAGIGAERVVRLAPGRIAQFEQLWVPSLPYGCVGGPVLCWTPLSVEYVRQTLGLAFSAPRTRRVFLSRSGTKWRRLVNESAVLDAIADLGFEVVDPGALTLAGQIELAASARVIAGTMGAGMNLLLFAAPGTAVVTIKGPVRGMMDIDPFLAAAIGQPYVPVVGRFASDDPDLLRRDIEVDPPQVRESILRALELAR